MMFRRALTLALLSLPLVACSRSSGASNIDVEKLPCTKRVPTSSIDVSEGFVSCQQPTEEIKLGAFTCKKGTTVGVYTKAKTLRECWVAQATTVDGVSCTGGVTLYPDGKLLRCQLDAEVSRNGLTVPKGAWLTLTPSGAPKRLELPQGGTIGSYKCKGFMNLVYENGKPRRCELAEPTTVDGQAKKAGETVCFNESGKLTDCASVK